ncbi:MAG TPA: PEGA domain-containing protein [Thermoanaerobaculia bacterium]|jgi:hypothetical protein|nr:PEGA domain-containing protein [Thermoanaerobaculia bacterium]
MRFLPVLAVLLAVAMSAPLAAGEHNPPDDSSDLGRAAEPRVEPEPAPEPPPPSPPPSEAPGASPEESGSEPRVAVPRTDDDDSHKQRPRTGSQDDGGGGDDGGSGYYRSSDDCNEDRYESQDSPASYVRTTGALDIDVSPGRTEVWIDGRYLGTADDFDGFPHYLWLERGVYELVLYREGYTTLCRRITVDAGSSIGIADRMRRGISVKPQDVAGRQGIACRPLGGPGL